MKNLTLLPLLLCLYLSSCASPPEAMAPSSTAQRSKALSQNSMASRRALVFIYRKESFQADTPLSFFVDKTLVAVLTQKSFTKVEIAPGEHSFLLINEKEPPQSYFDEFSTKFKVKSGSTYIIHYSHGKSINTSLRIERVHIEEVQGKLADYIYYAPVNADIATQNITAEDEDLWKSFKDKQSITAMENFIALHPDSPFVKEAKERIEDIKAIEHASFMSLKKEKDLTAYYNYLATKPSAQSKTQVFKEMVKLIKKKKSRMKEYSRLYRHDTSSLPHFPKVVQMQISLPEVGPESLNVSIVKGHLKKGVSPKLLSAKIKATGAPYKDFSFDEISFLKKMGLNDDVISAMIESTANFNERMKREQQNKKMQELIKNSIANSQGSVTAKQVKEDGGNTPVSCLKLKAALVACDRLGGFMGMACKVTARSSTECTLKL